MNRNLVLIIVAVVASIAVAIRVYSQFAERESVLRLPGTVEIQEVRLGPRVSGRVQHVDVTEGELVEAGRTLVTLDIPELRARLEQQKARVRAAEAALAEAEHGPRVEEIDQARAEVAAAQARWERAQAGPRVEEIDQARADLASAEADLRFARQEWDRVTQLSARGFGSQAEIDYARGARERLEGRVAAARAYLDLLLAGTRPEEKAEAQAELEKCRAKLNLLLAGTRPEQIERARAAVEEERATLKELQTQVDEATVVAPERAVVEVVGVRIGDLVQANQPVVRVLRAEDIWVKAYVPETQLGKIRLRQEVEVVTDSYPDVRFRGTIVQIASISEFTPRNVQSADERRHQVFGVKIRVQDPRGVFKSGMAADVIVPLHDAGLAAGTATPSTFPAGVDLR